jgi:hypothetical protein
MGFVWFKAPRGAATAPARPAVKVRRSIIVAFSGWLLFGTRDRAYLAPAIGSIPLLVIASAACEEERKAINRLALSASREPATMAAANT